MITVIIKLKIRNFILTGQEKIGKRKTKARRCILNLFEDNNQYLSAKDIHNKLKDKGIGIATVYRNLDLLEEKNRITKLEINGVAKYKNFDSVHQHHLICD